MKKTEEEKTPLSNDSIERTPKPCKRHKYKLIGFTGMGLEMKTVYQCKCGRRL